MRQLLDYQLLQPMFLFVFLGFRFSTYNIDKYFLSIINTIVRLNPIKGSGTVQISTISLENTFKKQYITNVLSNLQRYKCHA
jgi:hypothetical protein